MSVCVCSMSIKGILGELVFFFSLFLIMVDWWNALEGCV